VVERGFLRGKGCLQERKWEDIWEISQNDAGGKGQTIRNTQDPFAKISEIKKRARKYWNLALAAKSQRGGKVLLGIYKIREYRGRTK